MSNIFHFRSFQIIQDQNAMKIGTDGVLLGACTSVENVRSALDVGSGTGVISLMIAQRSTTQIDAVEINEENYKEGKANIAASPWANRIQTYHASFQDFKPGFQYDLIISNPPYFTSSFLSNDHHRNLARHQGSLNMVDFIDKCAESLHSKGKLSIILPVDTAIEFEQLAKNKELHCNKLLKVIGREGKGEIRRIMELSFEKQPKQIDELIIEGKQRHAYTEKYLRLMRDFLFLE